ncbi:MAG TPA: hypothetical protein VM434_17045 [Beijerinckiaceae bacterium]|nr:hypothetical protein [Beijerinckiaceae bacterium]
MSELSDARGEGTDPRREIALLEAEIEDLAVRAEAARKLSLAAKAVVAAGGVLLVATLAGLLGRSPLGLVVGLAALLGGIAFGGSNRRTRDDLAAAVAAKERRRAELIDGLGLRTLP